ncbi:MAG: c-type cytochrome [Verrucomicrobiota bacterium]|nr:c-type cytochrome [Verrucomicrobiota bacterium]
MKLLILTIMVDFLGISTALQSQEPSFPKAASDRNEAAALFQRLRNGQLEPLNANQSLDLVTGALAKADSDEIRASLLRGMKSGLEGQRNVDAPEGWSEISRELSQNPSRDISALTRELGQIFGDKAATQLALERLQNRSAPGPERRAALRSLVAQQNPELSRILPQLLQHPAMQLDAIRAYAGIRVDQGAHQLLTAYPDLAPNLQRAIVETLASRKEYAKPLLTALREGQIDKKAIPTYTARSLSEMLGQPFTDVYGDMNDLSSDKKQLIAEYKKLLTNEAVSKGDIHAGKAIYDRTCSACHVLYGKGGKIGPDLTGSNRADLNYILLNMLDPSGDIPEAYQLVTVTKNDGQIIAGTVSDEDHQRLILNSVGLQNTVLKSDIKERATSPYSMMPEGLLLTLADKDVIDLVKYLRTSEPVATKP